MPADVATELAITATPSTPSDAHRARERADEATADTDLSTHVPRRRPVFEDLDLHDVVLVGHSYAGAVIGGVAERLVALAASTPV